MKTKIIYISGNEVFDMADIRAAFEEVRSTLGLARDTILFGVPVDSDDAFNNVNDGDIKMASDNPVCTDSEQIDVVTAQPTISAQNDDVVTHPPIKRQIHVNHGHVQRRTNLTLIPQNQIKKQKIPILIQQLFPMPQWPRTMKKLFQYCQFWPQNRMTA